MSRLASRFISRGVNDRMISSLSTSAEMVRSPSSRSVSACAEPAGPIERASVATNEAARIQRRRWNRLDIATQGYPASQPGPVRRFSADRDADANRSEFPGCRDARERSAAGGVGCRPLLFVARTLRVQRDRRAGGRIGEHSAPRADLATDRATAAGWKPGTPVSSTTSPGKSGISRSTRASGPASTPRPTRPRSRKRICRAPSRSASSHSACSDPSSDSRERSGRTPDAPIGSRRRRAGTR